MMYGDIEKVTSLHREDLDPNNYVVTLLNEALRIGLIDQPGLEHVQAQAMTILAELIRKYTKGESSSVRVEISQRLLMSVFYAIDAGINKLDDPQDTLDCLLTTDLQEIYKQGLDALEENLKACRQLYQQIENNKLSVQNDAYQTTIDELPQFFRAYDILYNAQYTMANIDYPILFDDMDIQGVFYIKQYLEKLSLENQFCQHFALRDIIRLLHNYSRVYRINVQESLINIMEIVLSNAIFSVLSGNSGNQLDISPEQFALLQQRIEKVHRSQLNTLFTEAIEALISDLQIESPALKDYIRNYKTVLLPRFLNALEYNSLSNIIIVNAQVTQSIDIFFDEGNSLDDEHFREIAENIRDCDLAEDKAALIRSEIHSLGDFIDILEAECLFAEEFQVLYDSLGDIELSILARIVFIEDIRTNLMRFSLNKHEEISVDQEWQQELCKYLHGLEPERIQVIENFIKSRLQMNEAWDFLG